MTVSAEHITHIVRELVRIVDAAAERLSGVDERLASSKPAPNKWSYKEIIGHLIDSASNNHQRFIRAPQERMLVFPGYQQDDWVAQQDYNAWQWSELLEFWRLYNHHIAHVALRIPAEKLNTECRVGLYEPATLADLIEDYLTHLKHHLGALP